MPRIVSAPVYKEEDFIATVVVPRGEMRDVLAGKVVHNPISTFNGRFAVGAGDGTNRGMMSGMSLVIRGFTLTPIEPCEMFMGMVEFEVGTYPQRFSFEPRHRLLRQPVVVPTRQSLNIRVGWQGQRREELPVLVVLHLIIGDRVGVE